MDETPNSDMNINYHGTQGLLSTMPMNNGFNIDEDIGILELFKLLQEDPMNFAPSTSIENVALNHQHSDISELPSLNFQEDHETQGLLSTMPLNSELNIDEDIGISELFKLLQEDPMNIVPGTSIENGAPNHQHSDISESPRLNFQEQPMNTNIIPSISIENVASNDPNPNMSQLPNEFFLKEKPLTTNTIPSSSLTEEGDKNSSSRTTYQNTLDKDDNYSLFYIYSMGVTMLRQEGGRRKEDPIPIEGDINISSRREEDNSRTNAMILQQPMLKIPVLEKLEKESMKQKLTVDHPLVISTNTRKEKENTQTNDLMFLKPPMPRTPCLENLETDSMKPKFTIDDHSFGSSTRREQENPRTNAMILSPPIPKSPMLIEKESDFMKSKLTTDSQFGISTSRRVGEQENPKTNGLILQQLMSNIPILAKFEREFNKTKLTFDHPFGTSTSRKVEVKENPKTDGLIMQQQPMPNIPTLEKLESELMKRKTMPGHTIARKDGKCKQGIESGGFKSIDNSSRKEDEIRTGVVNSLDIELQQKTSSNGGAIRRLSNKTSSRYQPFGGQTPNKQGPAREVPENCLESTFNKPQGAEERIICDISAAWKNHLNQIKMKTGIGSAIAGSSYHRCMLLNGKEWKSDSSQVAEIEKQNCNDEESLVGARSSKKLNHSTWDFQHSPANTHEITNKLKGVASGQNANKETQVLGCANQEVTLGSTDSGK